LGFSFPHVNQMHAHGVHILMLAYGDASDSSARLLSDMHCIIDSAEATSDGQWDAAMGSGVPTPVSGFKRLAD
jgi:hypothetical protein